MGDARAVARKFGLLARLPPRRRRLLIEAGSALVVARIVIATLPFPRIARWLGPFTAPDIISPMKYASQADRDMLHGVAWALVTAARNLPGETRCLAQAIAGRAMCRRRGLASVVHMGAEPGQRTDIETHAWLDSGGVALTGYPLPAAIVEIGCFAGQASRLGSDL
jgi:hypothetical protein